MGQKLKSKEKKHLFFSFRYDYFFSFSFSICFDNICNNICININVLWHRICSLRFYLSCNLQANLLGFNIMRKVIWIARFNWISRRRLVCLIPYVCMYIDTSKYEIRNRFCFRQFVDLIVFFVISMPPVYFIFPFISIWEFQLFKCCKPARLYSISFCAMVTIRLCDI